jgi:hypothetical protein
VEKFQFKTCKSAMTIRPPVSSTNSWNIVESGVKYHQANTLLTRDTWMYSHRWFTCFKLELFHREAGLKLLCWFKLLDQLVLIWGNSFHLISLNLKHVNQRWLYIHVSRVKSVFAWWYLTPLSTIFQLLVEETGGPGEHHRPVASHWQTLFHIA